MNFPRDYVDVIVGKNKVFLRMVNVQALNQAFSSQQNSVVLFLKFNMKFTFS